MCREVSLQVEGQEGKRVQSLQRAGLLPTVEGGGGIFVDRLARQGQAVKLLVVLTPFTAYRFSGAKFEMVMERLNSRKSGAKAQKEGCSGFTTVPREFLTGFEPVTYR